jgi:hypothetical protein
MACVSEVRVQTLLSITRVEIQGWSELQIYSRLQSYWQALARLSRFNEAREGGAVFANTNLSWVK